MNTRLKTARILQIFLLISLCSCAPSLQTERTELMSYSIDSTVCGDSRIDSLIAPLKASLDSTMKQVIGYSDVAMEKGNPEGILNNFVCDAVLTIVNNSYKSPNGVKPDMLLLNSGGLRSSLPLGPITREDVFRLMPFDNELVIVTIPADRCKSMMQFIIGKGGMPVSGLELVIRDTVPSLVLIGGKSPSSMTTINILTSDYLAEGGDNMSFLESPLSIERTGIMVRDAIILFLQAETAAKRTVWPKLDGRIRYE